MGRAVKKIVRKYCDLKANLVEIRHIVSAVLSNTEAQARQTAAALLHSEATAARYYRTGVLREDQVKGLKHLCTFLNLSLIHI